MQLTDNNTLRSVDNKSTLRRHHRDLTHEDHFLLGHPVIIQQKSNIQRNTIGQSLAQSFQPRDLRLRNRVTLIIENDLTIVAFNGENFRKSRVQTDV